MLFSSFFDKMSRVGSRGWHPKCRPKKRQTEANKKRYERKKVASFLIKKMQKKLSKNLFFKKFVQMA